MARPVGPRCQVEKTFFELNKEELSLRATMDLVGPSRQALHVKSSSEDSHLLTTRRTGRSEAPDGNDSDMGKRSSGVAD